MRKHVVAPVFAVFAACLLFSANTPAFDEGIEYRTLARPLPTETGDKVEVLELFWYGCPHCFYLEEPLNKWLANKPDNVEFRRMPAVLGRGWLSQARAYYAAELLGVVERIHEPLFRALHVEKKRLDTEGQLADWFAGQGVDRQEFINAYKSFVVDMKVRRSAQVGQRIGLDGVPSMVVNGKYLTSPGAAGGSEEMLKLLSSLVAKEEEGKDEAAEAQGEGKSAAVEETPEAARN